jgi:hypothetical protein
MQKEFTNMIPNLQTSTGDEFAFCSAEWLVTDYQKILKLLQKEFEETSKKADPSKTFLWLNDESTILANFDLAQNKLKVETKSAKRLQNVKNILDKKASKFLKFEQEKIESVAEAMKNHTPSNDLKNEETQELEMDDDMKEMIFQKVQGNWASTPIPFLNDQTPLEAMKTKQGRDLLKELFKTYENTEGRIKKSGQDDFLNDTKRLKKMIGWKDN